MGWVHAGRGRRRVGGRARSGIETRWMPAPRGALAAVSRERDQRRAHARIALVAGEVRDRCFERGDHRVLLERRAQRVERRLLRHRRRRSASARQPRDRRRIDVGRGADAARTAAAQGGEQERLAAGENVEAVRLEALEHRLRVAPVARAVLHAGDRARIAREQPLDEREADRHLRHGWNVIQVDAQARVADALDHLGEAREQAVVADALVVERRQHQHAGAAGATAWRVSSTVSVNAQQPVPGIMRAGGAGCDEVLEQRELLAAPSASSLRSWCRTPRGQHPARAASGSGARAARRRAAGLRRTG